MKQTLTHCTYIHTAKFNVVVPGTVYGVDYDPITSEGINSYYSNRITLANWDVFTTFRETDAKDYLLLIIVCILISGVLAAALLVVCILFCILIYCCLTIKKPLQRYVSKACSLNMH